MEEQVGMGEESLAEREVIAERYVFDSFYLFGAFLILIGLAMSIWMIANGDTWWALLGLVTVLPGVWLVWFPLRQIGLPAELIVVEGGELAVTGTDRRTRCLKAEEIIEVFARHNLPQRFFGAGRSVRRHMHCGYVYLRTRDGEVRVGYVHRPFDVAEKLERALDRLRRAQETSGAADGAQAD